tara:strand:- start:2949 stop:3887 length:939 start_codon:yes stop_codon:yes gene_type:complete
MSRLVFPFRYDLRQPFTNFENTEEMIENTAKFIDYFKMLNIESTIFNIGSSLSGHSRVETNYQIFPMSLQENIYRLNENLTVINIDPMFVFSEIIHQINSLFTNIDIIKKTDNLLHIQCNINDNVLSFVFSRSLLPSYDKNGCIIIKDYSEKKGNLMLMDLINKYSACKNDKDFVDSYYNVIIKKLEDSKYNGHFVCVINYALKFNTTDRGIYFGFFKEFIDVLSRNDNISIFEFSSFKIDSVVYKNSLIKPLTTNNMQVQYKAFNTILHTGILSNMEEKHNNCVLGLSNSGKIELQYLNNDNKKQILIGYN